MARMQAKFQIVLNKFTLLQTDYFEKNSEKLSENKF